MLFATYQVNFYKAAPLVQLAIGQDIHTIKKKIFFLIKTEVLLYSKSNALVDICKIAFIFSFFLSLLPLSFLSSIFIGSEA
jgi:hypothetical protein